MIRLEEVCARYEGVECLHRVSASLTDGGLTGLIGPNGSGKTTLLKLMAGQIKAASGRILLNGRPLTRYTPKELAREIAYMPQLRPAPEISVRQLVTHGRYPFLQFGRTLKQEDRDLVEAAMARTGVQRYAGRAVNTLSGGERQRVYIAMALAQNTPFLLLDEPIAYLDMKYQFRVMRLLQELSREGKTILVVIHELELALKYCDRLLLMHEGNATAFASPEALCTSGKLEESFEIRACRSDGHWFFEEKEQNRNG